MGKKTSNGVNDASAYLRLIQDQAHDGGFNMAVDEILLRSQIQRKGANSILRFYRFAQLTVTVGYGLWRTDVPMIRVTSQVNGQIPIIRRITGGGMVLHGSDLTYSLIVPMGFKSSLRRVRESYFLIHDALRRALNQIGIRAELFERNCSAHVPLRSQRKTQGNPDCFASPVLFDVMLSGKKVAGGAQRRSEGYLLHQGSIAWDLVAETYPDVSEPSFRQRFSLCLGDLLGVPIKEIPLYAEEMKETLALV